MKGERENKYRRIYSRGLHTTVSTAHAFDTFRINIVCVAGRKGERVGGGRNTRKKCSPPPSIHALPPLPFLMLCRLEST